MDNNLLEKFKNDKKPSSDSPTFSLHKALLQLRNRHFAFLDVLFLLLTPTLALGLRLSFPWPAEYYRPLVIFTLLSLFIKLALFMLFRLYSRYWRYASIDEMVSITFAVITATLLNASVFWALHIANPQIFTSFPRSVPFIDGLITLILVGGTRFSIRIVEYWQFRGFRTHKGKRVLIVGAGDAGQMIVREILSSQLITLIPIGFVDDDPYKIGAVIHGLPVLGPIKEIPKIITAYTIDEVIIAMPGVSGGVIRNVVSLCQEADVPSRTVPGIYELLNGKVDVNRLRKVEINDLLRRASVNIHTLDIEQMLLDKRILITGAGGSIGSELCRQILHFKPMELVLLGHGENSLFSLSTQINQMQKYSDFGKFPNIHIVVCDIRDTNRLKHIFSKYLPQVVFHTAAHKHVPMMEENPEEAVTNNIQGTKNIVDISLSHGIEKFVFISTDKAVNPNNIMGMTKRIAELIVQNAAHLSNMPYVSVRFGNVLGSRGSAVSIFQEQIAHGGPITVTHPEVSRFFMTITEAVLLVLQAATMAEGGEVYVLDMGEPIKIIDLVRDMVELSGYQVGTDIDIVYTGLRPGERLSEELFADKEKPQKTKHHKIFVTREPTSIKNTDFNQNVIEVIKLAAEGKTEKLTSRLLEIIEANQHNH